MIPMTAFAADSARVIRDEPNMITVYQMQCELREILVEQRRNSGIVGGLIGGLIGSQVGGGSGQIAATAVGAIIGTNVTRSRTEPYNQRQSRVEYRNICNEVPVVVQSGRRITFEYEGKTFVRIVD